MPRSSGDSQRAENALAGRSSTACKRRSRPPATGGGVLAFRLYCNGSWDCSERNTAILWRSDSVEEGSAPWHHLPGGKHTVNSLQGWANDESALRADISRQRLGLPPKACTSRIPPEAVPASPRFCVLSFSAHSGPIPFGLLLQLPQYRVDFKIRARPPPPSRGTARGLHHGESHAARRVRRSKSAR